MSDKIKIQAQQSLKLGERQAVTLDGPYRKCKGKMTERTGLERRQK
jgi:hypothetical protein